MNQFYEILVFISFFILSYFIGAIPFAKIFVWQIKKVDLLKVGSGSSGTTNASRVIGKKWAFFVLILDIFKGFITPFTASFFIQPDLQIILISLIAVFGHIFSVYLKFKGGKGVATFAGTLLVVNFWLGLIFLTIILFVTLKFRIKSVGTFSGLFSLLVFSWFFKLNKIEIIYIIIGFIIILITHKKNIQRIIKGKESRI